MKSAAAVRTTLSDSEEEEEEGPYSARIDSGLVTTERSRGAQVGTLMNNTTSQASTLKQDICKNTRTTKTYRLG